MLRLPLRGEVGRDRDNDTADVLAAKRALARLGFYAPPSYGFDGYSDRPFEDGLRAYQAERGLRQDGWAAPGGETHRNIELDLSGEKRPFGHDLPRDARFTGSVGVNGDNERPDVQLAQRLLGALGLYRYDRTAEPHGFMDDAVEEAIFQVQRQRGLPETGRFEADEGHSILLLTDPPKVARIGPDGRYIIEGVIDHRPLLSDAASRRSLLIPTAHAGTVGSSAADRPEPEGANPGPGVLPAPAQPMPRTTVRVPLSVIVGGAFPFLQRQLLGVDDAPPPGEGWTPPEQHQLPGGGQGAIGNPVLTGPKPEILQPPQGTPAQAPDHQQLPGSVQELEDRIVSIFLENRRGNDFTKAQLDEIRDYAKRLAVTLGNMANDIKHAFGGRAEDGQSMKELFLQNKLTKGRRGGSYGDLTFENATTKRRLHIETVDIDPRTGEMTRREAERDARFRQNIQEGDIIINIPKSKDGSTPDLDSYSEAMKNAFKEISRMP